ncbi:MAG TPA: histidine--tRNA ligase [Actinomycetota bacterium]|nr:histidine--tRNA ligase [Actinomycetota bacterium]
MSEQRDSFSAPRGTRDLLPPESWAWQSVTRYALDSFALAGYAPVETPAFEHTEVFERGVGATTEVVGKQMYTFLDRGERSLTLRPEGTAPVVRAVLEHNLHRGALPVKLSYAGWMFRQERPQKGRYRQFFQLGIEAIGSDDPTVDAEVIEVAKRFYDGIGLDVELRVNSIGHWADDCRLGYSKVLVEYLRSHADELPAEDRARIETNPMRTFDSKEEPTERVMAGAPLIVEYLCDDCRGHYERVKGLLTQVGVRFEEEPSLVRGLDYYTRTAFEFVAGSLGSQNAVGGGGRYDGLAEVLGGPHVPGIGFALGLDRIMLSLGEGAAPLSSPVTAYVVVLGEAAAEAAFPLVTRLRSAGIGAELDVMGRGMKGQMKDADRSGARYAVILGDDEIASREATVKDLGSGDQERCPLERLEERLRR